MKINKTPNTPGIEFNPETGLLKIEGRSIPENPGEFFENLINWLEEYYSNPAQITQLELFLEYINSGSSKYLLSIFRMIKKKYSEGNNCVVNWYYEEDDEAIQSLGEHFKTSLRIPFNLIEYV
ncbi:MAG: DUF1987 domain-containing protein [Bacteroidales bacterium]|nr:DUF1987 domain-containing protein [Bacteroidales bacterium]